MEKYQHFLEVRDIWLLGVGRRFHPEVVCFHDQNDWHDESEGHKEIEDYCRLREREDIEGPLEGVCEENRH